MPGEQTALAIGIDEIAMGQPGDHAYLIPKHDGADQVRVMAEGAVLPVLVMRGPGRPTSCLFRIGS